MTEAEEKHNMQVAVAGSVIVHSALLFIMAWLMGLDQTARALWAAVQSEKAAPVAEEPMVTMVFPEQILPPVKSQKRLTDLQKFMRTDESPPASAPPLRTDFVSDKNTTAAASRAPFPGATAAMPTLSGAAAPAAELRNRDLTRGEAEPAPPPPTQLAMAMPKTEPSPIAAPPAASTIKMLETLDQSAPALDGRLGLELKKAQVAAASPKPAIQAPDTSREAFNPMTRTSEVKGTISTKGQDSVNATATPTGKFMRQVTGTVERQWHALFAKLNKEGLAAGYLKVSFIVNKQGKPEDLKFIEKTGDPRLDDLTLQAILSAQIPPIPAELLPLLDNERLLVEYDILIQ
jgi:outer membrane biosynthesis protein TonB